jgi:hypothetical protein
MTLASALLTSLVAFGTQWPIIDLPYPDVDCAGGPAAPSAEALVEEAIVRHARLREPRGSAAPRPRISQLRIEGGRASALVVIVERSERVQLERIDGEWRVVKPAPRAEK